MRMPTPEFPAHLATTVDGRTINLTAEPEFIEVSSIRDCRLPDKIVPQAWEASIEFTFEAYGVDSGEASRNLKAMLDEIRQVRERHEMAWLEKHAIDLGEHRRSKG